jgi:anti-anti-sigma factor
MTLVISSLTHGERGLRIAGEVDMVTAPQLAEALGSLEGSGPVTLDLSEVTFMDSSGLHVIEDFVRDGGGEAGVILDGLHPKFVRLFEIVELVPHGGLEIRVNGHGG